MTPKGIHCAECPLREKGTGFVLPTFPDSFSNIRLLICGEAPGKNEVEEGQPFVGKAGFWMRMNILRTAGLREGETWFDNTLRCMPPRNKKGEFYPVGQEKTDAQVACRHYDRWVDVPRSIPLMLVGGKALESHLGLSGVADWHGHISRSHSGRMVGCTYHPSAVMRAPQLLPLVVREIQNLLVANADPGILARPKVHRSA